MADSRDEKVDLNENEMMEQQSLMKDGPEKKSTSSFVGTWADWDKVNFFLAIFNLMNAILGSGILGLAYAGKSLNTRKTTELRFMWSFTTYENSVKSKVWAFCYIS
jgi:hypothetical protein